VANWRLLHFAKDEGAWIALERFLLRERTASLCGGKGWGGTDRPRDDSLSSFSRPFSRAAQYTSRSPD